MKDRKSLVTIYSVHLLGLTAVLATFTSAANAGTLTLTPTGVADGFTLTTFATLNPGDTGFGPFGIAVGSNGNIIVSNSVDNLRYVFPDVDGQTKTSAINTVTSNTGTLAYATAGGHAYGGDGSGHFVEFNNDGTINHVLTGVTAFTDLGMWGNPVNGHILATSSAGLIDINPLANGGAGSFRVVASGGNGDGVSVSPNGKIVYSEQSQINGYDIATGSLVFSSGFLFSSPDGTGVISSNNSLNGDIIVNTNVGEVDLLNPVTKTSVAIATGGTRGDYVSPDTNNGTLFLDYSEAVFRLSCGSDCSIGGPPPPPPTTPEPASLLLFGTGLGGLSALAYRRRKRN